MKLLYIGGGDSLEKRLTAHKYIAHKYILSHFCDHGTITVGTEHPHSEGVYVYGIFILGGVHIYFRWRSDRGLGYKQKPS